jgi:dephospho-CoA kinase
MRVIGVTGGIGSGKSTVSRLLKEMGAKVIDADLIAHQIVEKGQPALQELEGHFGTGILTEKGTLDRKKLAALVFGDKEKLIVLNGITHRYVAEQIIESVDRLRTQGNTSMVAIDVPIPVKHGFLDVVDEVWVVTADLETRLHRVMERSGLGRGEAMNRVGMQKSDAEYKELADHVIDNNGSLDELREIVTRLLHYNVSG